MVESPYDTSCVVTPDGTVNEQEFDVPVLTMSQRVTMGVVTVVRLLSSSSAMPSLSLSDHACWSKLKASVPASGKPSLSASTALATPSPSTSGSTSFVTVSPSRSPAGLSVNAADAAVVIDSSLLNPSVWLTVTV